MWALLAFVLKKSFEFGTPETLSWFRLASSACLLGLVLRIKKAKVLPDIKKASWWMVPASLALAFNYVAYANGLNYTTPGNAQMLIQAGPFLITIFTFLLGREKPTPYHLAGILIASAGFYVFYLDQLTFFINTKEQYLKGNLWILAGALAWAFWAFIQRDEAKKGLATSSLNLYVWTLCALVLLPTTDIRSLLDLTWIQYGMLAFLAINTYIAYGTYTLAYIYTPTAIVNLIIATNPILVFLISPDTLTLQGWAGAGCVFLGLGATLFPQIKSQSKKSFSALHRRFRSAL